VHHMLAINSARIATWYYSTVMCYAVPLHMCSAIDKCIVHRPADMLLGTMTAAQNSLCLHLKATAVAHS
jgi:hypothetical protein